MTWLVASKDYSEIFFLQKTHPIMDPPSTSDQILGSADFDPPTSKTPQTTTITTKEHKSSNRYEHPWKKQKVSSQYSSGSMCRYKPSENKRRSNHKHRTSTNSNHNNSNNVKNKQLKKSDVKPWWIGQTIIIGVDEQSRVATIRDYDTDKKLTHIWFKDDNYYKDVDLLTLDWEICAPLIDSLPFIPDNDWIPTYWKLKQRVMVRFDGDGQQYAAIIDGYDPISRRHHICYGKTHEWIWATTERVELYRDGKWYNDLIETERKELKFRDGPVPPPWDPVPYGLDKMFAVRSREMENKRRKDKDYIPPDNYNCIEDKEDMYHYVYSKYNHKHKKSKQSSRKKKIVQDQVKNADNMVIDEYNDGDDDKNDVDIRVCYIL